MKYRTIVADPPWPIGDFPEWAEGEGTIPCPYPTMSVGDIKSLPVSSFADTGAHLYLWATNEFLVPAHDVARAWGFEPSAVLVWCKPPRGVGLGGLYASNIEFILFCRQRGGASVLAITQHLADAADRNGVTRAEVNRQMGTSDMAGWWLSRLERRCAVPTSEQWPRLKAIVGADDDIDAAVAGHHALESLHHIDTRWWEWPRGRHSAKPQAFLDIIESVSPGPYLEMFARQQRMGWDTFGNEYYTPEPKPQQVEK